MKSSLTCLTVLLMVLGFTSGAGAEPVNVVKINSDVVIEENTKVRGNRRIRRADPDSRGGR
jgi:hypothetical protein